MKKIYTHIILFSFVLLVSSCVTSKQARYLQDVDANYPSVGFQEYKLRINDEVSFYLMTTNPETQALYNSSTNSGSANANSSYLIYENGCIYLPTLNWVKIAGFTLREAQDILKDAFLTMVPDAEIKLSLANNLFYVQGDGGKGSFYLYKENLNIYQALAMAGDISNMGDKKNIKIIRKGADGLDYVKTFDLRDQSVIQSEYYYIQPNDVIYIPTNPNSFFRVDSVTSFMSLFVAPISLLMTVVLLFNK